MNNYILDAKGNPKRERDLMTWARWYEKNTDDRRVAWDEIGEGKDKVVVSTVFLAIDHGFGQGGLPILWETMIFGGAHDQHQDRYTTREEAVLGHQYALRLAKAALQPV